MRGVIFLTVIALSLGHKYFESVFGSVRIATHFDSLSLSSSLFSSLSPSPSLSSRVSSGSFLSCSNYQSAVASRLQLVSSFGDLNVHLAYISEREQAACFLVVSTRSLQEMKVNPLQNIQSSFWEHIPHQIKLHQSVMYHLGLTTERTIHPTLVENFKMQKDMNLNEFTLIVSTGLGVPSKETSDATLVHERILHSLLNHQQFESLAHFKSDQLPSTVDLVDIWTKSYQEISSRDTPLCNFRNLKFQVVNETGVFYITNLGAILHESHPFHLKESSPSLKSSDFAHPSFEATHSSTIQSTKACYASLLATLSLDPEVIDIRLRGSHKVLNQRAKSIVQSNSISTLTYPYLSAGLTATGEVIGVGDTGVDENSCFFQNSDQSIVARSSYRNPTYDLSKRVVVQYVAYANDGDIPGGHGTHVCGTIAGSATSTVNYNGHGYGGKIAFFDMSVSGTSIVYPPPLSKNVFPAAYSAGAKLHSNSWGSSSNMYDDSCTDIDSYHLSKSDFLAIFAAGNDGENGYYSLGTPAISKNSLAVGASYNLEMYPGDIKDIASFSSIGPTFDSRFKPDIVAPGYSVNSANSGSDVCSVLTLSGTSMATPAVSGNAALVRKYFQDAAFWPTMCNKSYSMCKTFAPKGATVKAMMIHSGYQMDEYIGSTATVEPTTQLSAFPDYFQGFGRISLPNILPYTGIALFDLYPQELLIGSLQKIMYTVVVTDASKSLKATIVWMDPVNTIISSKVLLNDIDLQIIQTSTGTKYYGNNIPGDEVNNVEQIFIKTPEVGEYSIIVNSKVFVDSSSQPVTLIVTSGGYMKSKKVGSSTSNYPSNELSCVEGDQMINLNLLDHSGNGWGSGNSFVVQDELGTITYFTFTMNGNDGHDILTPKTICLTAGHKYLAKLIQTGSNKKDMGIEIPSCSIYLSNDFTEAMLDLTSPDKCNLCSTYQIQAMLFGPTNGVPYGWKSDTKYVLRTIVDENTTVVSGIGTLTAGVMTSRDFCVTTGQYLLEFDDVPLNDDFNAGGTSKDGIETYRIGLLNCGVDGIQDDKFDDDLYPYPMISPGKTFKITWSKNGVCSYQYLDDQYNPIYDDDDSGASIVRLPLGYGWVLSLMIGLMGWMIFV